MGLGGGGESAGGRRTRPGSATRFGASCAFALFLCTGLARAAEVLVVQSARIAAYDEASQAFQRSLATGPSPSFAGPKQVERHRLTTLILSDPGAGVELLRRLRARPPDLVLAVGAAALSSLRGAPEVPAVYLLVPDPEPLIAGRRRITGVSLEVSPSASLDALLKLAPRVRRVGLVFDPRRTGPFVAEAAEAARHRGVTLVVREARTASEVPGLLAALAGTVDALWMLPDLTVNTPEAVEALLLNALDHRLPVLTFSEKVLALGATVAVAFDPSALGEKAAELAAKLLAGGPATQVGPARADRFRTRINATASGKLGLAEATPSARGAAP